MCIEKKARLIINFMFISRITTLICLNSECFKDFKDETTPYSLNISFPYRYERNVCALVFLPHAPAVRREERKE